MDEHFDVPTPEGVVIVGMPASYWAHILAEKMAQIMGMQHITKLELEVVKFLLDNQLTIKKMQHG